MAQFGRPFARSIAVIAASFQDSKMEARGHERENNISIYNLHAPHKHSAQKVTVKEMNWRRNVMAIKMSWPVQPSGAVDKVGQNLNFHSWRLRTPVSQLQTVRYN